MLTGNLIVALVVAGASLGPLSAFGTQPAVGGLRLDHAGRPR